LKAVGSAELLAEAFDATGGIDELLLAGEERVAGTTDIDVDLGDRAAGDEGVATGAVDVAISIFGVDFRFHETTLLLSPVVRWAIFGLTSAELTFHYRGGEGYQRGGGKANMLWDLWAALNNYGLATAVPHSGQRSGVARRS
jgi:hypothetical protein